MHPLFRIDDGQDALLKLHSQAVARPDFRKLLDTSPRAQAAVARLNEVYAFECGQHSAALRNGTRTFITEADCRQVPNASALQSTGTVTAAQSDAAVAEAPEQWHTEAPTVAGIYLSRNADYPLHHAYQRWWDGTYWHNNCDGGKGDPRSTAIRNDCLGRLAWSHLIEADAPQADTRPLLKWVKGCDVPEGEREELFFVLSQLTGYVFPASQLQCWDADPVYLRAAPGVREGDAYNPALYREVK